MLADAFSQDVRNKARDMTYRFGEELRKLGYRGYFELDFLRDLDTSELYLGEVNPRVTGASAMTNLAAFAPIPTHRRTVESEQEAFFLRIAKPGDYKYEGSDLGILLTPGRLMTEDFELNEHARATASLDRAHILSLRLRDDNETRDRFVSRFLEPPLYQTNHQHGWETLYTAIYDPSAGQSTYRWPGYSLTVQSSRFVEQTHAVRFA